MTGPAVPSSSSVSALILAAGQGLRLGGSPKALLELGGSTLLELCVSTAASFADEIIVGLPADIVDRGRAILKSRARVTVGGETRQATFDRLLQAADRPLIVIHEVARPFASDDLWRTVLQAAEQDGGAAPVLELEVRDSIAEISDGYVTLPLDRSRVGRIQTPYAFEADLLRTAVRRARDDGFTATSITTLVTRIGGRVRAVPGEAANLKITYPEDWAEIASS